MVLIYPLGAYSNTVPLSSFPWNSVKRHGGLFEGPGLIVKIGFYMGAYLRAGLIRGVGAKSRTCGILMKILFV